MQEIRNYMEHFVIVPDRDWNTIKACFEEVRFSMNEVILGVGFTARYFYFQKKGLVRFYMLVDGEEVSRAFLPAPCFFTARKSFIQQSASEEGVHCLEAVEGWRLSFSNYQKLSEVQSWNRFMVALLHLSHDHMDDYVVELLRYSAEERYENMLNQFPAGFLDRIPLKYLSSSLGITPQSLSRIRRKIA